MYGYFDNASQTEPADDPGLGIVCPYCKKPLSDGPVVTASFLAVQSKRSYFYRMHKICRNSAPASLIQQYETLGMSGAVTPEVNE